MKHLSQKGFTFVELIVVVVILGVLATIGLVSYSSYLGGARDSNRLTQISDIKSGLNVYSVDKFLPLPEESVNILANANIVAYQGYVGEKTLNLIGYSDGGKDPLDNMYFTYYLTKDKRDFQLMAFLEEENLVSFSPFSQAHAANVVDYSERYPTVTGKKLGVLVENMTNTPVQEIESIVAIGDIDIATVGTIYKAYYNDSTIITGTGGTLVQTISNGSCKRILELGNSIGSGIYKISPTGVGTMQVYCDMETDGGGWTILVNNDNSDNEWESNVTLNPCYPRLSGNSSHACGSPTSNSDFVANANGMKFSELVWAVFGTSFKDIKTYRLLKWNSQQEITSSIPLQIPAADNDSDLLTDYEALNFIGCSNSSAPARYIETGTPANGFPHNPVTILGRNNYDDGKIGFTDANQGTAYEGNGGSASSYGFDDFQDGQSCGNSFSDINYQGYSSYIMVR